MSRSKAMRKSSLKTETRPTPLSTFVAALFIFLVFGLPEIDPAFNVVFVREAQAVIGRPGTPGSVAGVRRRTRRRTRRRVAVAYGTRVYALPVGYQTVVVTGTTYYIYDGVYYKPYYEGDKIIYVVVEEP
jgi:hypothetical protein